MNLRELRTALDGIPVEYDQYEIRTLPTSSEAMIAVIPDLTGRRLRDTTRVNNVLLIRDVPGE